MVLNPLEEGLVTLLILNKMMKSINIDKLFLKVTQRNVDTKTQSINDNIGNFDNYKFNFSINYDTTNDFFIQLMESK